MKPRHILGASPVSSLLPDMAARTDLAARQAGPTVRVVVITLDSHLASATERAYAQLAAEIPGLSLQLHAAAEFNSDAAALARAVADIEQANIIIATMLFMEDHIQAVLPALRARREHCDALIGMLSASEVVKLTRIGRFNMDGSVGGPLALLKRLRGKPQMSADGKERHASGAQQMKMLRRIPQILRFIPGTAQDVRAYFMALQYWLAGSEDNVANLVRLLLDRYADGPRRALRGTLKIQAPTEYAEVGVYHPRLKGRIADQTTKLPVIKQAQGTVGVLVMRSYVLAGNSAHYDAVIAALETRGLSVITAFASGLDARPAIEKFFMRDGHSTVDTLLSLTGFSLVGGPAYNDTQAAEHALAALDVPYLAAQAVEFQTLEQWQDSGMGLLPVEATMMVAIPELDGATGSMLFGGRSAQAGATHPAVNGTQTNATQTATSTRDMQPHVERIDQLAARIEKLVQLRRLPRAQRKLAITLFNFPPSAGNTGTAAHLAVFESLHQTLRALSAAGYSVEVPISVDALRRQIIEGNAARFGTPANVHARIVTDDHVRREKHLAQIEAQWGPAPGRVQTDGASIFVMGARFGNVFVGIQPGLGYEGDPMRLLFEKNFAPTHAFSAFYRYLREDFGAHAVLHFGTHGALEFMPGKQTALSADCWPDRLIGALPNFYLYAANNPSEGAIAKRRSAATLVSYLTPPLAHAGLYRGLLDLKASLDRWRSLPPDASEVEELALLIQAQAAQLDLTTAEPAWAASATTQITRLIEQVRELEDSLIPHGLHVMGQAPTEEEQTDLLLAIAEASHGFVPTPAQLQALIAGQLPDDSAHAEAWQALQKTQRLLAQDHELPALIHALDGGFVRPAPGGDLLRTPEILPTGRNVHGFDPFRIPSAFAVADGVRQAEQVLARHLADGNALPETVALVLWGTDNLKSEGGPIAQALALLGAKPRFDSYGRLAGAALLPLSELGRPRIDVMVTLSGIFRDLLPLQTKLLAEAAYLAATADEPLAQNFVRKHALQYQAQHGCDLETASLRVFSNDEGAYGSNVNHLVHSSRWDDEDELAETYTRRKGFAYGRSGRPIKQNAVLASVLADVSMSYQNLESVELGVTTLDHYFDTLGGISRAVKRARGSEVPVYIGDQTRGDHRVRSLAEQVALETRTRMLNPKWTEGMLKHGFEGVRQIEDHVTNTLGWSATTGQVAPWVYAQITQTYMLDEDMRERLAQLNPSASVRVAHRLLEAHRRQYWTPDASMLAALRRAGEDLEDRLEGVGMTQNMNSTVTNTGLGAAA